MAEYTPHQKSFKTISTLTEINIYIFWFILVLSIVPIVFKDAIKKFNVSDTIDILNIIAIVVFFVIEIITEYILIPAADNQRRDDFIDNSFGSKFTIENSKKYYDNDEISNGIYKAGVNLFENCFFTYYLVKAKLVQKIILPSIGFFIISIIAYYGFKEVPIGLSILQTIFSANILGNLVKQLIVLNRLSELKNLWITLFQNEELQKLTPTYQAFIYRYWLQYETLISKINMDISISTYQKLNPVLTEEWQKLKAKLNIS